MGKILEIIDKTTGVMVTYDPKKHLCKIGGNPVTSVTRVLRSNADEEFFALNYAKIQAAGELGSHVHHLTELQCLGKKVTESKYLPKFFKNHDDEIKEKVINRVRLSLRGWENFRNDHSIETPKEWVEYFVYDVQHRYSGLIDRIIKVPKRGNWILDIKTGMLKPQVWLQTGGYAGPFEKLSGETITGRVIVQLPGTSETGPGYKLATRPGTPYKPLVKDFWKADYRVFLCKLTSYYWDMENLDK